MASRNFLSAGSLCRTDEMIRLPRRLVKASRLILFRDAYGREARASRQIERTRSRAARAIAARCVFRAHR